MSKRNVFVLILAALILGAGWYFFIRKPSGPTKIKPPEPVRVLLLSSHFNYIRADWVATDRAEFYRIEWGVGQAETKNVSFEITGLVPDSLYKITIVAVNKGGEAAPYSTEIKTRGKVYAMWDSVIDYKDEFHLIKSGPVIYEVFSVNDSASICTPDTVYHFTLGRDPLFKKIQEPCILVRCKDKAGNIGPWSEIACLDEETIYDQR